MGKAEIWAPDAEKVELETGGRKIKMEKTQQDLWQSGSGLLKHSDDYAFLVDGKGPFPDPRSRWQPQGVHKPSRWLEHEKFEWHDPTWQPPPLSSGVIYEMHTGTFTPEGTFDAAVQKLPYLVELGVTHVELMPVAEFPGNCGWGYDGVSLYAPYHKYGGPHGLKRFVNACHELGLAVLLDVVYNHLGPSGNYLGMFGPYFTSKYATPWGDAVNFDGMHSDKVRSFFIDNALMWLRDYHIDGLRIDAVHAIIDTSAVHLLEQMSTAVKKLGQELGRHLVLIAESDLNDPRIVMPSESGGYGIDAQWNEDFHHALHALLTHESQGYYRDFGKVSDLARVLTNGFLYDGRYSVFRRRAHGRPASDIPGCRFIGCIQNHDQIGNRALGSRISSQISPALLKTAAAMVMTSPFVPMLFMGEEWACTGPFMYFTDHTEPELAQAVREGRKKEFAAFGWDPDKIPDPQDENTFRQSKLNWDEPAQEHHKDILDWYKSLIRFRRNHGLTAVSAAEKPAVEFNEEKKWFVIDRGSFAAVFNFSKEPVEIENRAFKGRNKTLASDPRITPDHERINMPGESAVILI